MADWGSTDQAVAPAHPSPPRADLLSRVRQRLATLAIAPSSPDSAPSGWRRFAREPAIVAATVAVVLAIGYLLAPHMGGDLAAQVARADFARDHPLTPIDLRWFGGTITFGYSLWTTPVMAVVGARVLSAVATVVGAWATTRLFQRAGARRPLLGGLAAAVCQAASMVEGRTTFNVGMACGLCCLLLLGKSDKYHRSAAAAFAVLAAAASPMAALLLWVCAGALLFGRRYADSIMVLIASGIPVIVTSVIFGEGGVQIFDFKHASRAVAVTLLAFLVTPKRLPLLRIGALLGAVMVAAAYVIPTPVGSNSMRLSLLFAVPTIVAFNDWRRAQAAALVALALLVQNPVSTSTVKLAGGPDTKASYYTPLIDEVARRGPVTGRIEVPESTSHWEATYVAQSLPFARGWLRQTDVDLNHVALYDNPPNAATYRQFLDDNFVQYVAISDARTRANYGGRETALVLAGLPYLTQVWSNAHWRLYAVDQATSVVGAPGRLTTYAPNKIVLHAPPHSTVHLGLRWFRWLTIQDARGGACLAKDGPNTELRTGDTGGTFTVGSTLPFGGHHC